MESTKDALIVPYPRLLTRDISCMYEGGVGVGPFTNRMEVGCTRTEGDQSKKKKVGSSSEKTEKQHKKTKKTAKPRLRHRIQYETTLRSLKN